MTNRSDVPPWVKLGLTAAVLLAAATSGFFLLHPERAPEPVASLVENLTGANPHPVKLLRPPVARLSALAQLGKQIFFDPSLSASGQQSCASCHSPQHAYGPPNDLPVQIGGPHLDDKGFRPPPSLTYLYRQQPFSIGPDLADVDAPTPLNQTADQARGTTRSAKVAGVIPAAPAIVPQGGLFWDGRRDTLQMQADGPMTNPVEMANANLDVVAQKLIRAKYSSQFKPLFGSMILDHPSFLVSEAMSAVARYQIEERSFHAFDSKYDAWLEGKARLSPAELRGLRLFNDKDKANCAGCHPSKAGADGLPPLFTDTQYEALGVPRNTVLPANRDAKWFDMGICGPFRTDLAKQTQYCGMFLTPTLRNSATRKVFFHNGYYHSLDQVLAFYNFRDTRPERIYPTNSAKAADKFNDLPSQYHANIDVADGPFNRKLGEAPAMSNRDMADIVAFIRTLNDGYGHVGSQY